MNFSSFTDYIQGKDWRLMNEYRAVTSFKYFNVYDSAHPGAFSRPYYGGYVNPQACCTTVVAGGSTPQVPAEASCVKYGNSFCDIEIIKHFQDPDADYAATTGGFSRVVDQYIETDLQKWYVDLERLFWKGDKTATTPDVVNGVIKTYTSQGGQVTAGTNDLLTSLIALEASLPSSAYDHDTPVVLCVGTEIYRRLKTLFIGKPNYLLYEDPQTFYISVNGDLSVEDGTAPAPVGAQLRPFYIGDKVGIPIIRIPGLSGLFNGNYYTVATYQKNISLLTNRLGDYAKLQTDYSKEILEYWIRYVMGVGIDHVAEMSVYTISPTVFAAPITDPIIYQTKAVTA